MARADALQYLNGIDIKVNLGCGNFFPNTILVADHSSAVIRNNLITENLSGGIGVFLGSTPVIDVNQIIDNHGPLFWAGGLFVAFDSAPVVTGNSIKGNQGAALWVDESSALLDQRHDGLSLEGFAVIEDSNPTIAYSKGWDREVGPDYSGGTGRAAGPGAFASLKFTGTGVSFIYCGGGGMAEVDIDGMTYPPVDTFSPEEEPFGKSEQVLATGLKPGEHVLTVTVSNEKNPLSTGHGVCLDAFGVLAGTNIGSNEVVGAIYAGSKSSLSGPHPPTTNRVLKVPAQYAQIQDAIETAIDGDTIIVEPGTYTENIDFIGKQIILRSNQPNNPEIVGTTIIEAMKKGPTVLFASSETSLAVLKGLTLQNDQGEVIIQVAGANPTIFGNIIHNSASGAISVCHSNETRITGNTIRGNNAAHGGVIDCFHASPIIENNMITDNTGSAINTYFSSPIIANNYILNSTDLHGTAAAIYLDHFSPAIVRGNTILRTRSYMDWGGAAIILDFFSNCLIENNIISGNLGDGIFAIIDSSPLVTNNVISGNGGGLNTSTGHPILMNNTVVGNLQNGIYVQDIGNVTIINNIFSNAFEIATEAYSQVNVTYSNIKGGYAGEGNISQNPMFIGGDDYRLKDGSPCIDSGTSVDAPGTDIDGIMRPQGDGVDMGAYEFESVKYVDSLGTCTGRDPCHERIQDAIDSVAEGCGATLKVANGHYRENLRLNSSKHIVLEALDPQYNVDSESIIKGGLQLVGKTAVIRKGCFTLSK